MLGAPEATTSTFGGPETGQESEAAGGGPGGGREGSLYTCAGNTDPRRGRKAAKRQSWSRLRPQVSRDVHETQQEPPSRRGPGRGPAREPWGPQTREAPELLAGPAAARGDASSPTMLPREAVTRAPGVGGGALAPHGEGTSLPLGWTTGGHPCALANVPGTPRLTLGPGKPCGPGAPPLPGRPCGGHRQG